MYIYIYIYIHTHTHIFIYLFIYSKLLLRISENKNIRSSTTPGRNGKDLTCLSECLLLVSTTHNTEFVLMMRAEESYFKS